MSFGVTSVDEWCEPMVSSHATTHDTIFEHHNMVSNSRAQYEDLKKYINKIYLYIMNPNKKRENKKQLKK